jgi:DNA-directed RNA polymerase subunit RPC12/RpoP
MAVACLDCGKDLPATSQGRSVRCKGCANAAISKGKSTKIAETDEWLIKACLTRPITQVAKELGLTRQAVYSRLRKARERRETRKAQKPASVESFLAATGLPPLMLPEVERQVVSRTRTVGRT